MPANPPATAPAGYVTEPVMGFWVNKPTRRFIVSLLIFAFTVVGLGALAALGIVFTRAPAIKLLDPYYYYMFLTFHGILMLTMFPHIFESSLWVYTSTVMFKNKMYNTTLAWGAFGLIFIGIAMILVTVATGEASVMYTTYIPLRAYPTFYLGHVLYAVGLLLVITLFAFNIIQARMCGLLKGSLPLITFGMATSAVILLVAIISAVVAFLPATLWAFRIFDFRVDPLTFKAAFWGMGHTLQYTNVTAMVIAWYMIASYALKAKPVSEKFSRYGFVLYLITTLPVFGHHLQVDPTWSPAFKWFGATLVGIILGIASMIHGIAVPASVEKELRRRGAKGWFGFLKQWGWGNPSMVMLFFSIIMFGIGGFDGTAGTTTQLNMILHNTMWLPAHIHGALAGGMAVAFMGLAYYYLPALGIQIRAPMWLRQVQAYSVSIGFVLLIAAMHWGAELGVPRRTQDIAYLAMANQNVPIPDWFASMNFLAIGGSIAGAGVLIFSGIMLWSIIRSWSQVFALGASSGMATAPSPASE